MRTTQPSTPRLVAATVLCLLPLFLLVPRAIAQDPWEGWIGPPSDGIYGLRFGMDRFTVDELVKAKGLESLSARPGTLRYEGQILGERAELVAEFHDDALGGMGGRLRLVKLRWNSLRGTPHTVLRLFEELDALLQARYDAALARQDAGAHDLENGRGQAARLYHGVEMKAVLQLFAPRPRSYDLQLRMEYPPLIPAETP